jgi:hypothetical protein
MRRAVRSKTVTDAFVAGQLERENEYAVVLL